VGSGEKTLEKTLSSPERSTLACLLNIYRTNAGKTEKNIFYTH